MNPILFKWVAVRIQDKGETGHSQGHFTLIIGLLLKNDLRIQIPKKPLGKCQEQWIQG